MITIGLSGGRTSFTEEATEFYARREDLRDARFDYLVSVERVLLFLKEKKVDFGIFPVANSTSGVVRESLYAMANHIFSIKEIFDIPVRLFLLALPETAKENITTIVSHPQIFHECEEYLKTKWPHVSLQEHADTAKAAEELKAKILPEGTAVIAPRATADLYDLKILAENIQDQPLNHTTFVVAS